MGEMLLFVGLGNPTKEYEGTRHNCGFCVLDMFAKKHNLTFETSKFKGEYAKYKDGDKTIFLLKPHTFMNLSGECVRPFMDYYKIDAEDLIIISDDMDNDVGAVRVRTKGSSGGHNGLKSIFQNLGTEDIKRIKIGIGKPAYDAIDFVLGRPTLLERPLLDDAFVKASNLMDAIIKEGFERASSKLSKWT